MSVRSYLAYCSARDQNVRVVRASELASKGHGPDAGPPHASDVVCLDYGASCSGSHCPLFEVPTLETRRQLGEAGLR